ncbi:hypothetical protein BC628DRAFT_248212 [Trametes gibbosa]|nr:hypothetical protein BC628DRAFT_248212 [Trametes gibbosa]
MQTSGCIGWVASIYDARNPSHSCAHLRRWDLQLRSLAAAYPDPEDAIFSFVGDDLVHLSLRDWPRAYCPMRGYVMLQSGDSLPMTRSLSISPPHTHILRNWKYTAIKRKETMSSHHTSIFR